MYFSRAHDIALDGHLDEVAWRKAKPLTTFFETYPGNLARPEVPTEARFLYDDEHVYIGVTALEPDPSSIRSSYARRDAISQEQDYLEVLLDPLNTKRTAYSFTTNPNGARRDGQFNDDEQLLDTRPDFDFDVQTSLSERGWEAEFRIPLATLRYQVGDRQTWAFVIVRNRPRVVRTVIASIPEPRKAACKLCFAGAAHDISMKSPSPPVYVTPQVTYSHVGASDDIQGSVDAKWVPRSDTVVDLTVRPDFSQVEADDLQLTANARFALAVKEKRSFFLEGADLFSTPLQGIYTRSFAQPEAGVRVTHRGNDSDYSALALRDQGGGLMIEPGPLSSQVVSQPFESTALVGRYQRSAGPFVVGALASARTNDASGGGSNYVYGIDAAWSPNSTDRVTAQVLASDTVNPHRPDLLPSWDGRLLDGTAHTLAWQHSSDRWYATVSESTLSPGFRAWNGFVPQVGVSTLSANSGLMFYTSGRTLLRLTPGFTYLSTRELGGTEISSNLGPFVAISLPWSTEIAVGWTPKARETTAIRSATYDYWTFTLTSTPARWLPEIDLRASFGEGVDLDTGQVNTATQFTASIPLRLLDRLELTTDIGYETQNSRAHGTRVFTQRNAQLNLLWHFTSKLYVQALYQNSQFTRAASDKGELPHSAVRDETFSALLSYQTNWQTRFFIGLRHGAATGSAGDPGDTEIFAKFSYVLSKWPRSLTGARETSDSLPQHWRTPGTHRPCHDEPALHAGYSRECFHPAR